MGPVVEGRTAPPKGIAGPLAHAGEASTSAQARLAKPATITLVGIMACGRPLLEREALRLHGSRLAPFVGGQDVPSSRERQGPFAAHAHLLPKFGGGATKLKAAEAAS
jgi:hypothetical protein